MLRHSDFLLDGFGGVNGLGDEHEDNLASIVMETAKGREFVMKTAPEVGIWKIHCFYVIQVNLIRDN